MTTTVLSDAALLARFRESHEEFNTVGKILARFPVGPSGEEDFVESFAETMEGGAREARRIYRSAANTHEMATLIWLHLKDATSPFLERTLFANIPRDLPASFLAHHQSIPTYEKLFESLRYVECEPHRSVFGAPAYFVDLLRFVETYIVNRNPNIPSDSALHYRRPDLVRIPLDEDQATNLVPYIDIVIELLEAFVTTPEAPDRDPYETLNQATFPTELPFSLPLTQVRAYLERLNTSLSDLYRVFAKPFDSTPGELEFLQHSDLVARELLRLSPLQHQLITIRPPNAAEVGSFFGGVAIDGPDGLRNVDVFLLQTGMTREQLNQMVYQGLDRHEINSGLSRLFYVNRAQDGFGHLTIVQDDDGQEWINGLSTEKLDRIHRFSRLRRALEWSAMELDLALRSLAPPYTPEKGLKFDGVSDYVACRDMRGVQLTQFDAFTIEAWVQPDREGQNFILGVWSDHYNDRESAAFLRYQISLRMNPQHNLAFSVQRAALVAGEAEPFEVQLDTKTLDGIEIGVFSHVAAVVTQRNVRLFLNGQVAAVAELAVPLFDRTETIERVRTHMTIGGDVADKFFAGVVKDVRLWSRAWESSDLQSNRYRRFSGLEEGLVGYWPLTESPGNRLPDRSANRNDGVMGGDELVTQPVWVSRELVLDDLPTRSMGRGLHFNGIDAYAAAQDVAYDPVSAVTIEAWIRFDTIRDHYVFVKGDNEGVHLGLWIGGGAGESTFGVVHVQVGAQQFESTSPVSPGVLTHIAVTIGDSVAFYLDGRLDRTVSGAGTIPVLDAPSDLRIARNFGDEYLHGSLKDVRLWSVQRTADQIGLDMYRAVPSETPGLIGNWHLSEIAGRRAPDSVRGGHDLHIGGVATDYQPEQSEMARPIPDRVAVGGTALEFDGDNDVLTVQNPQNRGLGAYERLTLEFWFKPSDHPAETRKQVLFTQGDREAGLCIYRSERRMRVVIWNNDFDGNALRSTTFASDVIAGDEWHHIAVVQDEFIPPPVPDTPPLPLKPSQFTAILDGVALTTTDQSSTFATDLYLSPVGAAYLGGLATGATTRFETAYSEPGKEYEYFFAGLMADIRVWHRAKTHTEIAAERHLGPTNWDDLVAYLPASEGAGWVVHDRAGDRTGNPHNAALQDRNIVLVEEATDPELVHVYAHYSTPTALRWKDYVYAGRMRCTTEDAAMGVTFLSRYPDGVDQYYRFGRDAERPAFHLAAHPHGVQRLTGQITTDVEPDANRWYRFLVVVEDTETETLIQVKVWLEGEAEPEDFQIVARDVSQDVRLKTGTVGVWTDGRSAGARQFDNLRVWPLNVLVPAQGDLWMDLNFEAPAQIPNPDDWQSIAERTSPVPEDGLFRMLSTVTPAGSYFGTDSNADNIHAHFHASDTTDILGLRDYTYEGRFLLTDKDGGIGVTFLSQYPADIDQYYCLRSDPHHPTLHLEGHPARVQTVKSADPERDLTDSGIDPNVGTWYWFRIEMEDQTRQTSIRVKIWPDGSNEPADYQISVVDDSSIRLTSGTVGVWASGAGLKLFDQLRVRNQTLLAEDFTSFTVGEVPPDWEGSTSPEEPGLFDVQDLDGELVLASRPHRYGGVTHYLPQGVDAPAVHDWTNYVFTGRLRSTHNAVAVTFLDKHPQDGNAFFSLATHGPRDTLQLSVHRHRHERARGRDHDHHDHLEHRDDHPQGRYDSEISIARETWYRFAIEIEDARDRTCIRAKVWLDGTAEPSSFQIDAFDDRPGRPRTGSVGLWSPGRGTSYYDDLRITSATFVRGREYATSWSDTGSRDYHAAGVASFTTVDTHDNQLRWARVDDLPVLLQPLSATALRFDGKQEYAAGILEPPLAASELTIEAWIRLSGIQPGTIISLNTAGVGLRELSFGFDENGLLSLAATSSDESRTTFTGSTALPVDDAVHVAVRVLRDGRLSFFVDGTEEELRDPLDAPSQLEVQRVDVGRDSSAAHFVGDIKEIRIWSTARSDREIAAGRFERPAVDGTLSAYWSLGEEGHSEIVDRSGNARSLLTGGLSEDRQPDVRDLEPPATEFWRSDRNVLGFDGTSEQVIRLPAEGEATTHHRRTIEVWFRIEDRSVNDRKQVIYQDGDAQSGLNIYVFDSRLYFGAFDANGGRWDGAWISTHRIESGRWHHAALVLDGRRDLRPHAMSAYIDGKLIDSVSGTALTLHDDSVGLGGLTTPTRFHDGASVDGTGSGFVGQMLDVRIWATARSGEELRSSLTVQVHDAAGSVMQTDPRLYLWWSFDNMVDAAIVDQSGNDHSATVTATRVRSITLPVSGKLPQVTINRTVVRDIAAIRELKNRFKMPMERITAMWSPATHRLYDAIFNPVDHSAARWGYHMDDRPIRWHRTAREQGPRDREIESRLVGALRASPSEIQILVNHLSGARPVVEMDGSYLRDLYRFSHIAHTLGLKAEDLLRLMAGSGITDGVSTLADVLKLTERAAWLRKLGMTTADLDFLEQPVGSAGAISSVAPYTDATVFTVAQAILRQAENYLFQVKTLGADEIGDVDAHHIMDYLKQAEFLATVGAGELTSGAAVTGSYSPATDLNGLLTYLADVESWMTHFDTLQAEFERVHVGLGEYLIQTLQDESYIAPNGVVLVDPDQIDEAALAALFADAEIPRRVQTEVDEAIPGIKRVLEARSRFQEQLVGPGGTIHAALQRTRGDQQNSLLTGLGDLFGVELDIVEIAFDHLGLTDRQFDSAIVLNWFARALRENELSGPLTTFLTKIGKLLYLTRIFDLSSTAFASLLAEPGRFDVGNVLRLALEDLQQLYLFKQLLVRFEENERGLIEVLGIDHADVAQISQRLEEMVGWSPNQLDSLVQHFGTQRFNHIEGLTRINACFALASDTGVDASSLLEIADTAAQGTPREFEAYRTQANTLRDLMRALSTDAEWEETRKSLRAELSVAQRDALLALAVRKLDEGHDASRRADLLYEYFLLDPKVGPEVQTSRIVQASAGLQLYIQRCLLNLEPGVDPDTIPTREWEWVKNYRVWEANRKVFLYPENYIEPELRDTKTPIFVELERELMRSELDENAVANAYTHYLDRFMEIATLRVVGSYLRTETRSGARDERDEHLYLIGRTDTQPKVFYFRERVSDAKGQRWLHWNKIDLAINSDFASPVYAFGRLFLFWTEFTRLVKSVDRKLSDSILKTYGAAFLDSVFTDPIKPGELEQISYINSETDKRGNSMADLEYMASLLPRSGRYAYLRTWHVRPWFIVDRKGFRAAEIIWSPGAYRRDVDKAYSSTVRKVAARRALEAELDAEEIKKLEKRTWIIDEHGYLFNTRTELRVQKSVDVYNTTVKYSYFNFSGDWIQPQIYQELENELSETAYRQPIWQRIYAQRVLELTLPDPDQGDGTPETESNTKVLEIAESTRFAQTMPRLEMSRGTTWSCWSKVANRNPVWISAEKPEPKSITLLDYANGALVIRVSNRIDRIPGSLSAEQHAEGAAGSTQAAVEDANAGRFKDAAVEAERAGSAAAAAEQEKRKADKALQQDSSAENSHHQVVVARATAAKESADTAETGRGEATRARDAANAARQAAQDPDLTDEQRKEKEAEAGRLENIALEKEREAKTRATAAKNAASAVNTAAIEALRIEREERPDWYAVGTTYEVADGKGSVVTIDADFDLWHHLAVVIDGSGATTVHLFAKGVAERSATGSFRGALPQQDVLLVGQQTADVALDMTAQMSELRVWDHARKQSDIADNRFKRQAQDAGLFNVTFNSLVAGAVLDLVPAEGLAFTLPMAFTGDVLDRIAERERIILFYGDRVVSLRNNFTDQSFRLIRPGGGGPQMHDVQLSYEPIGGSAPKAVLHMNRTPGLSFMDIATGEDETLLAPIPTLPGTVTRNDYLLQRIEGSEAGFHDVGNQPGWYIADVGDEQYLVRAIVAGDEGASVPTIEERLRVDYDNVRNTSADRPQSLSLEFGLDDDRSDPLRVDAQAALQFKLERLNTFAVYELSQNLFTGGIDRFLSIESQSAENELDFWGEYQPNVKLVPRALNQIPKTIDFNGAYRRYYEEIFFHIPFLIANKLNASQRFAEAQKWYHYIFNPTAHATRGRFLRAGSSNDRFWQYRPFRGQTVESLRARLTDSESLAAYRDDPFDPHAIAELRPTAYQKAVVMKYIDNLLDWGDQLFAQDTRESVNEAMLLYVLAYNVLGPRPRSTPIREFRPVGTYDDFQRHFSESSEFLTAFEKEGANGSNGSTPNPFETLITDFSVPENREFIGYWDRVEDRMFKIRHSLNIEGVFRQLALFEPPIDPRALVRAVSGGGGISGGLAALNVAVPHYRYGVMLAKTKEMLAQVTGLGSALLAAIESGDAERLAALQTTHERTLLEMIRENKKREVDVARKNLDTLRLSKSRTEAKRQRYDGLISAGLNALEITDTVLLGIAQGTKLAEGIVRFIAELTRTIPESEAGVSGIGGSPVVTISFGGEEIGSGLEAGAIALNTVTSLLEGTASIIAKHGEYARRESAWEFERDMAERDLLEIAEQIEAAEVQVAIANHEVLIHDQTVKHNQELATYHRSKFTSVQLYDWMAGRLAGLYFQAYRISYDMAKATEKAMQYELPSKESFISPTHWDGLKRGLLAGESLALELSRMEKVHLEQDSRFLEIEKTISMANRLPGALATLLVGGAGEFQLTEQMFDADFPGHYFRVIKSIEFEIRSPAALDPDNAVNATLLQLGNRTLVEPDIEAVRYLVGQDVERPDGSLLRINWRANQQIAVSKLNQRDDGLFVLDFFWDDRYFPFEGTGAVSSWRLEIPHANNAALLTTNQGVQLLNIDDILIHVRYTAKMAQGSFRDQVTSVMAEL